MADWEQKLPPIVRERLAKMGDISHEEKQRIKDSETVDSLLAEFYRAGISSEVLWTRLKEYREQGKENILKEVQLKLLDSLTSESSMVEVRKRKEGVVAIETLKSDQNTSVLEAGLNSIEDLKRRYEEEMKRVYDHLRAEVEKNPRLRMEQIKQGQNVVVMQLTVDEAIKRLPQWRNFIAQYEKKYAEEFAAVVARVKRQTKLC